MGRIFKRGELKEAIVAVVGALGEAHGYAIMGELKARIGGGWKPSPGAIYPAILALEDEGFVASAERDGTRVYRLTEEGRRAAATFTGRWGALTERAGEQVDVGAALDAFASGFAGRRTQVDPSRLEQIEAILARAAAEIVQVVDEGER
jgi:DNA-binding PadR family transcriptional regulator